MTTTHRFLKDHPIDPTSEKLILGTIHPQDHDSFQLPFFYGNQNTIWQILNQAFPGELGNPLSVEGILSFLKKKKISISDTILECGRIKPGSKDEDLVDIKLNYELINQIKNSTIKEILFTSGFGKNNAFKLFYEGILGLKTTPLIRKERQTLLIDPRFDRPIKLIILYSPSGSANVGLSKSALFLSKSHLYSNTEKRVSAFKVDYYREMFAD